MPPGDSPPAAALMLADLLVAALRDLSATRRELADVRLLHAAERDYMAWLQAQLLRAWSRRDDRPATIADVISAWHAELDRRAKAREQAAA